MNGSLAQLADLNVALTRNGATPELLDRRDAILADVAEQLDVAVTVGKQGTVTVYTSGGVALLDGGLRQLVYERATLVGPTTAFGAIRAFSADQLDPDSGQPLPGAIGDVLVSGGVRAKLPAELLADAVPDDSQRIVSPLRGGRLQGLLEARDTVLPDLADELSELADMTRFTLNAAHNSANAYPPPSQLTGSNTDTGTFAAAARSGTAHLAVIDRTTGAVAATVDIDVGAQADAASLAAQIAAGLGGYGTAGLAADGHLEISATGNYALALSEGDSSITATDPAGQLAAPGLRALLRPQRLARSRPGRRHRSARTRRPGRRSRLLSRAMLDVDAGPPTVARLGGAGDNRGAQALAAAFEASTPTIARGGLPAGSFRLADYAAELGAVSAGAADRASNEAELDQTVAGDLAARRSEVAGVDLDEELTRLVLYQQAYGASARLLAVTDQMFSELLAVVD